MSKIRGYHSKRSKGVVDRLEKSIRMLVKPRG
jgi:hypothetical protein